MNVELLHRIKAHILENPMRIYMGEWSIELEERQEYESNSGETLMAPDCGTVACICGWAERLSWAKGSLGQTGGEGQTGRKLLGLHGSSSFPAFVSTSTNFSEAQRLFHEECWPQDLRDRLAVATFQSAEYARVVADRIDRFIATDGKE